MLTAVSFDSTLIFNLFCAACISIDKCSFVSLLTDDKKLPSVPPIIATLPESYPLDSPTVKMLPGHYGKSRLFGMWTAVTDFLVAVHCIYCSNRSHWISVFAINFNCFFYFLCVCVTICEAWNNRLRIMPHISTLFWLRRTKWLAKKHIQKVILWGKKVNVVQAWRKKRKWTCSLPKARNVIPVESFRTVSITMCDTNSSHEPNII